MDSGRFLTRTGPLIERDMFIRTRSRRYRAFLHVYVDKVQQSVPVKRRVLVLRKPIKKRLPYGLISRFGFRLDCSTYNVSFRNSPALRVGEEDRFGAVEEGDERDRQM